MMEKARPPIVFPSSSTMQVQTPLEWDAETLYSNHSRIVSMDENTLRRVMTPKRTRARSLVSIKSEMSMHTALDQLRPTPLGRQPTVKDIFFKSLSFVTMLPRISAARDELAGVQRNAGAPLSYRQTKILGDLLDMTRDELPYHMRRSALRLIEYSFGQIVQDIFTGCTRQQFLRALKELCSESLPHSLRKECLVDFNSIVSAGAFLKNVNFESGYKCCRDVMNILESTSQVSLKLVACAYLWLARKTFDGNTKGILSETDLASICLILSDLTQPPLPKETREDALDWLWRFENGQCSRLSVDERRAVWKSILALSGITEWDVQLRFRYEEDCLPGLRRLWWFSINSSWSMDMLNEKEWKQRVGLDLLCIASSQNWSKLRAQAFELIALFSNLPHWQDMYDESTWRTISNEFGIFCLQDIERVNKSEVMRRVGALLARSTSEGKNSIEASNTRRELQLTRRVSVVIKKDEIKQITAASKSIRDHLGPGTTVEGTLENLSVFTLPGESLLIQKDQQAILYERICNYAKVEQTHLIAVQAMYALMSIQDWLSSIRFAFGPPSE